MGRKVERRAYHGLHYLIEYRVEGGVADIVVHVELPKELIVRLRALVTRVVCDKVLSLFGSLERDQLQLIIATFGVVQMKVHKPRDDVSHIKGDCSLDKDFKNQKKDPGPRRHDAPQRVDQIGHIRPPPLNHSSLVRGDTRGKDIRRTRAKTSLQIIKVMWGQSRREVADFARSRLEGLFFGLSFLGIELHLNWTKQSTGCQQCTSRMICIHLKHRLQNLCCCSAMALLLCFCINRSR